MGFCSATTGKTLLACMFAINCPKSLLFHTDFLSFFLFDKLDDHSCCLILLLLKFAIVGCSWVDCFPFSPRSSPDFYIEVDKRAMLTTGQENTSPPSPSRPRIALKIGNSSSSPPTLTLTAHPSSSFSRHQRWRRLARRNAGLAGGQDGGR